MISIQFFKNIINKSSLVSSKRLYVFIFKLCDTLLQTLYQKGRFKD